LFNAGNPIAQASRLTMFVFGINLAPLVAAFPGYAAFHLGVGLAFFLLAARRLRARAAELAGEGPPPEVVGAAARRPPVSDRPVVWKEMYVVPVQFQTRGGRRMLWGSAALFAFLPAAVF